MMNWTPEQTDAVAERKPRRALLLKAECVTGDGQAVQVRVRNLSTSGMGASCDTGFTLIDGEAIHMVFRGHRKVAGQVSWVRGKSFGVTFDRPVDPESIREAAIKAQTEFEVEDMHRVMANCRRPPLTRPDDD